MPILNEIAFFQNRRDEVPNQVLAAKLAKTKNRNGIEKLLANLENKEVGIQTDCLKVLYEVGYLNPQLIVGCVDGFLKLIHSKNNRLVWGAMIGLSTIASLQSETIAKHVDEIIAVVDKGSVITIDNGVKTLAAVASKEPKVKDRIMVFLMNHLITCRSKDMAQHSESILVAIDKQNKVNFIRVLETRRNEYSPSQLKRIAKTIAAAKDK
jgi:hypothetical protein